MFSKLSKFVYGCIAFGHVSILHYLTIHLGVHSCDLLRHPSDPIPAAPRMHLLCIHRSDEPVTTQWDKTVTRLDLPIALAIIWFLFPFPYHFLQLTEPPHFPWMRSLAFPQLPLTRRWWSSWLEASGACPLVFFFSCHRLVNECYLGFPGSSKLIYLIFWDFELFKSCFLPSVKWHTYH